MQLKISRKMLLPSLLLILVIIALIAFIIGNMLPGKSIFIVVLFLVIISFSIVAILLDSRVLSMNKIVWYFTLIFMGIAPLCQYVTGYYPWRFKISDAEIEKAQFLVLLFNAVFFVLYRKRSVRTKNERITKLFVKERRYSETSLTLLAVFVVIGFFVLVYLEGFNNLFIKGENTVDIENSTVRFIVKKFLSALPAMGCVVYFFSKRGFKERILLVVMVIITILSNFPTSTSRYWMGTILLGLIVSRFVKRSRTRKVDFIIIGIVVVVFPFFYIFKFHTLSEIIEIRAQYAGVVDSFNTVDFDAFTMIARATRYVSDNGITWGNQLLNIILFFIPRSLWVGKPITTNTLIVRSQGQTYTNLSCPLPAEGYVNFGFVGVFIYAVVLALYCSFFDRIHWNKSEDGKCNLINMLYPFLTIILFYVCRGPLQPSFIQTIAMILPMFVITIIFQKKTNKNKWKPII